MQRQRRRKANRDRVAVRRHTEKCDNINISNSRRPLCRYTRVWAQQQLVAASMAPVQINIFLNRRIETKTGAR